MSSGGRARAHFPEQRLVIEPSHDRELRPLRSRLNVCCTKFDVRDFWTWTDIKVCYPYSLRKR